MNESLKHYRILRGSSSGSVSLIIGVPKEQEDEHRVALTPSHVNAYLPHDVLIESGCGTKAGFPDELYLKFGNVQIVSREDLLTQSDVLATVGGITDEDLPFVKKGAVLVGLLKPFSRKAHLGLCANYGLTTCSLEALPRITRAQAMDVLSSQANLAGYRAVIEGAYLSGKVVPLMMTAAGTVAAARVLVVGAGVAGLQAIATAKRLGAVVSAFDVRSSAREQIESLGASFVHVQTQLHEGEKGYAKETDSATAVAIEEALTRVLKDQDIVITTAQIPGKRAPLLIKKSMLNRMKSGSIVIDLSGESGGNVESGIWGSTVVHGDITLVTPSNILKGVARDASLLFSKNMQAFLSLVFQKDFEDELVKSTLMTHEGQIYFS